MVDLEIPVIDLNTLWNPTWILSLLLISTTSFVLLTEKWLLSPPANLPEWLEDESGVFPRISACLKDWKHSVQSLKSGYSRYGAKGEFFVRADALFKPEIMVPREYVSWVLQQPLDVLSVHEARYEKFALDMVLPEYDDSVDQIFLDTIHRKMTRNLTKLQPAFAEEVSRNMDAALGTDTENWVEANVWLTVEKTVFSAIMRILVGESVCRKDQLRVDLNQFTRAFGYNSLVVGRILPRFLRSTVGWVLSIYVLVSQKRLVTKWFTPLVEERFAGINKRNQDPSFEYNPPQDLITWASDALLSTGNVVKCSPWDLARRLAIMIPAAVPAIKITTTNTIYDVLSSPPEMGLQDMLYNEISNALDPTPGKGWADTTLLNRLVLLNSAIRETMRLNPVSVVTLERKINPKEGVTLPSGQHLPHGTWIGVPVVGVHSDENLYPNAASYEPFRFCNRKPGESEGAGQMTSTGVVNVTDTFLPFGAGKFACPGRWLAAHIVKMSTAYLLYNYEVKPLDRRPLNQAMFGTNIPDRETTMMVRRRKH
ncbi:cytochrome P450 [Coniochaeta sp. 2T2.1]|nr:cytochrome P450 [Coniochaeta sp. 2T2.1]